MGRRRKNEDGIVGLDSAIVRHQMPPVFIKDLTQKGYADLLRQSHWNNDYSLEYFKQYFGVPSIDGLFYSEETISLANSLVVRYIFPEFAASRGLTIARTVCIFGEGECAAEFSNIEVSPGKFESRLSYGDYLLSGDAEKYAVHMEAGYSNDFKLKVISRSGNPGSAEFLRDMLQYAKDHNFLKGKKIDPQCNFIKFDKTYTWDDVVFPEKIKDEIRKNLLNLIDSREIYHKNGLQLKRGLIFSGVPGCGKTQTFKVLCNQVDWTVLWVSPKHLERGAKAIAQIVTLAKELSPTIMLLEDIDLYGGSRESNHNPALLGEMMNQLDGVQDNTDIITIATTNNKEVLEKALLDRPGRFDKVIDFPLPDEHERFKMLQVFSNGLVDDSVPFLKKVADVSSKGMTGAEVRELVNMAILLAVDEKAYGTDQRLILTKSHFDAAKAAIKTKDFTKVIGINTGKSSSLPFGGFHDEDDD